jgi:hypothetical protein
MTLTEGIASVRSLLKSATGDLWSPTEITEWLNKGNDVFHSNSGITDRWQIEVVTDDEEIGFSTDILRVQEITFIEGTWVGSTFTATTGAEEEEIDEEDYEFYDNTLFLTDPIESGGALICYGERLPTEVEDADESFEIPREYEEAIVSYAVYKAKMKDEDPTAIQDFQLFSVMRNEFERKPIKINPRRLIKVERKF